MAKQRELFRKAEVPVQLSADSREPRVWVKRLVIWSDPETIIRDIPLRRGLNIVWSPDPGAGVAELGAEAGSGHGAGKSLFCRLLRYCLGEESFAASDLRHAVAEKYPKAIVGAEVVVGGRTWGVIRPLGIGRKTVVGESSPEALLIDGTSRTGITPLIGAIEEELRLDTLEANMPTTAVSKAWLLALAWLSRDQDARFAHILDWRHARSESGSPAAGLARQDGVVAVRLLLRAITAQELTTRARLNSIVLTQHRTDSETSFHQRSADLLFTRLTADLGVAAVSGPLTIDVLQSRAKAALAETAAVLDSGEEDFSSLRTEIEQVIVNRAVLNSQQEATASLKGIQQQRLRFLRGERANLDAEELKARLGPMCPVCSVPIDEALASGCGLSHVLPDLDAIAADRANTAERIAATEQAIGNYEHQQREREKILGDLAARENQLRSQLHDNIARVRGERQQKQRKWLDASERASEVERLSASIRTVEELQNTAAVQADERRQLEAQLESLRDAEKGTVARLASLFQFVCTSLLGPGADASLSLTGQGLRAEVRVGGTAMESLKAIAFDVAALLMTLEGRTHLPALLIHDSPREADLGISHYHRLFRLMAELEQLSDEPPFQYIITTTTNPPEDMESSDFVIAKLRGAEISERLLRAAV